VCAGIRGHIADSCPAKDPVHEKRDFFFVSPHLTGNKNALAPVIKSERYKPTESKWQTRSEISSTRNCKTSTTMEWTVAGF
jgi:hypothetical protein